MCFRTRLRVQVKLAREAPAAFVHSDRSSMSHLRSTDQAGLRAPGMQSRSKLASCSFRKTFEIKSAHIRIEHRANSRVNPSAFGAMGRNPLTIRQPTRL